MLTTVSGMVSGQLRQVLLVIIIIINMKHSKITEMEIEEIKRELQASQKSHQEEKGKGELEHAGTMGDGEQQ
jgi:Na+/melibiose symporter-like transporter